MTGSLEHNLLLAAREGVMMSIWPTRNGDFQANVAEQGSRGWTCVSHGNPAIALNEALRQRLTSLSSRHIVLAPEPEQIDIEEAIAAAVSADDEDLIG